MQKPFMTLGRSTLMDIGMRQVRGQAHPIPMGSARGSLEIPGGLKELLKERRTYEKRREGLLETDESETSFRKHL